MDKIEVFCSWSVENHPGKFFGIIIGFVTSLFIVAVGFWQTLLIAFLSFAGYYLGKCWDEQDLPEWAKKFLNKFNKDKSF